MYRVQGTTKFKILLKGRDLSVEIDLSFKEFGRFSNTITFGSIERIDRIKDFRCG